MRALKIKLYAHTFRIMLLWGNSVLKSLLRAFTRTQNAAEEL